MHARAPWMSLAARAARLAAVVLAAALVAPSVAVASPLLPPDVAAAGTRAGVAATDQVIVRWAAADLGSTPARRVAALQDASRTRRIASASGSDARFARSFGTDGTAAIYRLAAPLGREAGRTLDAIAHQPGVVSVEPDTWMTADAIPNDGYANRIWGALGPTDASYYGAATYGINAVAAWGTTTGAGVRVAVIDTGIVAHADLAGQSVAGYDFISDAFMANDGDGRDADASDPGDWVTQADVDRNPYDGCTATSNSSWHGSHVAGTIAAVANNAAWGFGVAPDSRIVPVRALGKCGGYMSDIADAITWASGGAVTGVPAIAAPAKVLNLSLGGESSCSASMQTAITDARARGSVVVVAAGNAAIDASRMSPANCTGSLVVAATGFDGKRASFSDYGSIVDVAAPGVDIWSTVNGGTDVPLASPGGDRLARYQGTSMATPHVAGLAALLVEDHPGAQPAAIEYAITHGVTAFPPDGTANSCTAGANCGAGIANAPAAIAQIGAIETGPPTATISAPAHWMSTAAPVFAVTFSRAVTGLTAGDLSTSGTAGCTVGSVSGSGATWAAALAGCGEGTVTLTLDAGSVADAVVGTVGPATAVASAGDVIDRTPPASVAAIAPAYVTGTTIPVVYTITEANVAARITAYYTTANTASGATACGTRDAPGASGSLDCTIPAADGRYWLHTIAVDAAGNTELPPAVPDDAVLRDGTGPTAAMSAPASPTSAATLAFGVTFNEPVSGLVAADLSPGGTATDCTVGTPTTSDALTWAVPVSLCSTGSVDLTLAAGSVTDAYGNAGPVASVSSSTVTIARPDTSPPRVTAFSPQPASDTGRLSDDHLTNAAAIDYDLEFSRDVTGLAPSDLHNAGTAGGCAFTVSGGGTAWTVRATGCGEGTLVPALAPGSVTDGTTSGPAGPDPTTPAVTMTIDRTAPALSVVLDPATSTTSASFTLTITGSEPLDCGTVATAPGTDFTETGIAGFGTVTGSGTPACGVAFTAAYADGQQGVVSLGAGPSLAIADDAGNAATSAGGLPVQVRVDRQAPVVSGIAAPSITSTQPVYAITFSEPVTGFTADDISAGAGTATGCTIGEPVDAGGGATYTVSLAGCTDGTVRLVLTAGAAQDPVGHVTPAAAFPVVVIDSAAPKVPAPRVSLRAAARLSGSSAPVTVAWAGADGTGSPITGYVLQASVNGGAFRQVATLPATATAYSTTAPTSGSIVFKLVATDGAGISGEQVGTPIVLALAQQSKATYRRTWTAQSSSGFSGGSAKYAKASGASASFTFTGRQIAFVTTRASNRGKVRITIGTRSWTYDLRGSTAYRWIPWSMSWSTRSTRTVKVTVLGTAGRPRIDVDAFVVMR